MNLIADAGFAEVLTTCAVRLSTRFKGSTDLKNCFRGAIFIAL